MKRVYSQIYLNTRSRKKQCVEKKYITPSMLYNSLNNDHLIDFLSKKSKVLVKNNINNNNNNNYNTYIQKKGIEFENLIVKYINDNITPVIHVSDRITEESLEKTKQYILEGKPIIHSAPLRNDENQTQGIADLIVRSDYINKLVENQILTDDEIKIKAFNLLGNYHYIVVDIKFSTIPLRKNGIHLMNTGSYSFYKSQCYIYTTALGKIQGYQPQYAFILGRRSKNSLLGINYNSLSTLGKISYDTVDLISIQNTNEAIKWITELDNNYQNWTCFPPSNDKLYPNMNITSKIYQEDKEKIAKQLKEITLIWNVGLKHRNIALTKGIKSYKDINCNTKNLGINGKKEKIINHIIEINKQDKDLIRPKNINYNITKWRDDSNEIFLDFETIGDIFTDFSELPYQPPINLIFMIGIGYKDNNQEFNYKSFIAQELTIDGEFEIMNEFIEFYKNLNNPRITYWSADKNIWEKAEERQFENINNSVKKNIISDNWNIISEWFNMTQMFHDVPIVIKDCYKFGLKEIVEVMNKHNFIKIQNNSECKNGMTAMVEAYNYYKDTQNKEIINNIEKYNKFDVEVLYKIINYLRKNH